MASVSAGVHAPAVSAAPPAVVLETIVSPFHCLFQDAIELHQQSHLRLPHSEAEGGRLARAAFLLYMTSAEAIAHQAVVELVRQDLIHLAADPAHPRPLAELWRLLPSLVGPGIPPVFDPNASPWPEFAEVLALRDSWAYPGAAQRRAAYYQAPSRDATFEPLRPHQIPAELDLAPEQIAFPRTGLPRDPYALRPKHLDIIKATLDAAIADLDRRMGGALTLSARHRKEPVRIVYGH